jgi:hypothetical protein
MRAHIRRSRHPDVVADERSDNNNAVTGSDPGGQ